MGDSGARLQGLRFWLLVGYCLSFRTLFVPCFSSPISIFFPSYLSVFSSSHLIRCLFGIGALFPVPFIKILVALTINIDVKMIFIMVEYFQLIEYMLNKFFIIFIIFASYNIIINLNKFSRKQA